MRAAETQPEKKGIQVITFRVFSPISKQRQIYNIFRSFSRQLILQYEKEIEKINATFHCNSYGAIRNWCSLIKNELRKNRVLRCLFNLIFAYSTERQIHSSLDRLFFYSFLSRSRIAHALGCYFSAWIGWQFSTSTNAWHFASAGERKKLKFSAQCFCWQFLSLILCVTFFLFLFFLSTLSSLLSH